MTGGSTFCRCVRAALVTALLAGCASPPEPRWRADAADAFDAFQHSYLDGRSDRAEREFAQAQAAVAATGRLDLAARAVIVRCGLATATLDFTRCEGLDAVLGDADPVDRAYARFLRADWTTIDVAALPERYRPVVRGDNAAGQLKAVAAIADPLSRLVASGVLFRADRQSPAGLDVAIDAASTEGLRRPLLAWLEARAAVAAHAGDAATLATLQRRIALVQSSLSAAR